MSNHDPLPILQGVNTFFPLALFEKAAEKYDLWLDERSLCLDFFQPPVIYSWPVMPSITLDERIIQTLQDGGLKVEDSEYSVEVPGTRGRSTFEDMPCLTLECLSETWILPQEEPVIHPKVQLEILDDSMGVTFSSYMDVREYSTPYRTNPNAHASPLRVLLADCEDAPRVVKSILREANGMILVSWGELGLEGLMSETELFAQFANRRVFIGDIPGRNWPFWPDPFPFKHSHLHVPTPLSASRSAHKVYKRACKRLETLPEPFYTPDIQTLILAKWQSQLEEYLERRYKPEDE